MGSATSTGKRARNGGGDDDSGGGGGAGGDKKPFGEFDADDRWVQELLAKGLSKEEILHVLKNQETLSGGLLGDEKKEGRLDAFVDANTPYDGSYTPGGGSLFRDGVAPCVHDNSSSSDPMFTGGPPAEAGGSSSSSSSSSSSDAASSSRAELARQVPEVSLDDLLSDIPGLQEACISGLQQDALAALD